MVSWKDTRQAHYFIDTDNDDDSKLKDRDLVDDFAIIVDRNGYIISSVLCQDDT